MVVGSRFAGIRSEIPGAGASLANTLTTVTNIGSGLHLSDTEKGIELSRAPGSR